MTDAPAPDGGARARLVAFTQKTLIALALLGLAWLLVTWSHLLLLIFSSVLVAVALRALADPIRNHTPLGDGLSLAAAGLAILAALVGAFMVFGVAITGQLAQLGEVLPDAWEQSQGYIAALPFGERLLEEIEAGAVEEQVREWMGGAAGRLGQVLTTFVGGLAEFLVVIFGGLFFAGRPAVYRDGLVQLTPMAVRERLRGAANVTGKALTKWLLGQLVSMTLVGVLVGVGAAVIGLPAPAALGLVAGLLEFVPIVGPVLATVPGLLLALTVSPTVALWTLLMYVAVQQLEANLITPLVQKKAADLPPALTLFSVLAFATLFGPLGVLLATPLAVVGYVLVKRLWVRETLGDETEVPGED